MSDKVKNMTKINYQKLIISLLLCLGAGFLGSLFTTPAIDTWYATLLKPFFNPPNWIFAPVWTTLFILMGIALYLIWQKGLKNKKAKVAVGFFIVHLGFNSLWSIIFFGLHNPGLAFIDIVLLWLMIVFLIYYFYGLNKLAAWLLMPYLLWVSFATILNYSIWLLN